MASRATPRRPRFLVACAIYFGGPAFHHPKECWHDHDDCDTSKYVAVQAQGVRQNIPSIFIRGGIRAEIAMTNRNIIKSVLRSERLFWYKFILQLNIGTWVFVQLLFGVSFLFGCHKKC